MSRQFVGMSPSKSQLKIRNYKFPLSGSFSIDVPVNHSRVKERANDGKKKLESMF